MATVAPGHAAINDRQGRLTLTMIDDLSQTATSTGTQTSLTFVSRLMSSDVSSDTKIDEVVEIGTNGIVGGVANLGEFKGKFSRYDTSCKLLGLITGKFQSATPGVTTNWTYYDLANANFDYVRLIADPTGAVFAFSCGTGAVLNAASYSQKSTGIAMEDYDFQGPHLAYVNGYPIGKVYNVTSADATSGTTPSPNPFISFNSVMGGAENPIPILPPAAGQPPSALYSSGRCNFLKITRVLGVAATVNGVQYAAGARIRYKENQNYFGANATFGTPGGQTITPQIMLANGTLQNYMGPELVVGAQILVGQGTANAEVCTITSLPTGTSIRFTTTLTHPTVNCKVGLNPTTGQCLYSGTSTNTLTIGDPINFTGTPDTFRLIAASYGTNSTPTQIGTSSTDTTDVPGVPGRVIPLTVSAYGIPRATGCDIKVTIARKQVQGLGENEIAYGTAGVPKIDYSLDVMATDNSLMQVLQTGSTAQGSGGDIFSTDYQARYMLANSSPLVVSLKNPNNNTQVIKTYTGGHAVFGSVAESGSSTSEMSLKMSGMDYSGSITISATT